MDKHLKKLAVLLWAVMSFSLYAQEITLPSADFKTDMLSALNPGTDLGLSSDVKSKVDAENSSFINDVLDIAGSSDDDATKKMKINARKNQRDGMLGNVIGDDVSLKSYKKKINKQLKPYTRKYKLAKLIL